MLLCCYGSAISSFLIQCVSYLKWEFPNFAFSFHIMFNWRPMLSPTSLSFELSVTSTRSSFQVSLIFHLLQMLHLPKHLEGWSTLYLHCDYLLFRYCISEWRKAFIKCLHTDCINCLPEFVKMADEDTAESMELFSVKLIQELHMSQLYLELKSVAKVRNFICFLLAVMTSQSH